MSNTHVREPQVAKNGLKSRNYGALGLELQCVAIYYDHQSQFTEYACSSQFSICGTGPLQCGLGRGLKDMGLLLPRGENPSCFFCLSSFGGTSLSDFSHFLTWSFFSSLVNGLTRSFGGAIANFRNLPAMRLSKHTKSTSWGSPEEVLWQDRLRTIWKFWLSCTRMSTMYLPADSLKLHLTTKSKKAKKRDSNGHEMRTTHLHFWAIHFWHSLMQLEGLNVIDVVWHLKKACMHCALYAVDFISAQTSRISLGWGERNEQIGVFKWLH